MARLQTYHIGTPVKNSEVSDRGVPVTEVFPHIVTSAEAASAHAAAGLPFVVMGTKSEAARDLLKKELDFTVLELIRSDRSLYSHPENVASLPLVCFSDEDWLSRIDQVTVWPAPAVDRPWSYQDRKQPNNVLFQIHVGAMAAEKSFKVRVVTHTPAGDTEEIEDLGLLSPSISGRREFVLETTKEDADRIRKLEGVTQIAQRRVGKPPGPTHVRLTVACDDTALASVVKHTGVWAPSLAQIIWQASY